MLFKLLFYSSILILTQANQLPVVISPDYDSVADTNEKPNLRTIFLNKKRETERQKHQLKLLEQLDKNQTLNIIYADDIPHNKVIVNLKSSSLMKNIENEFRDLITMKEVKYFYKRDQFWRTWRPVKYPDGTTKVVNYKYQSMCNVTHRGPSACDDGGIWIIEDAPLPCPYEIFSLKRNDLYCVVEHSKLYRNISKSCPTKLDITALSGSCDNPIVTEWKFEKDYSKISKLNSTETKPLSQRRHRFDLLTLYIVNPQQMIFRIVNSSDDVIYSRIMRSGNANYVCIENCGKLVRDNYKLVSTEKPVHFDLFDKGNAPKKRSPTRKPSIAKTESSDATAEPTERSNEFQETVTLRTTTTTDGDWLQAYTIIRKQTTSIYNYVMGNYFKYHRPRVPKEYTTPSFRVAHCKKLLVDNMEQSQEYSDSKDQSDSDLS